MIFNPWNISIIGKNMLRWQENFDLKPATLNHIKSIMVKVETRKIRCLEVIQRKVLLAMKNFVICECSAIINYVCTQEHDISIESINCYYTKRQLWAKPNVTEPDGIGVGRSGKSTVRGINGYREDYTKQTNLKIKTKRQINKQTIIKQIKTGNQK